MMFQGQQMVSDWKIENTTVKVFAGKICSKCTHAICTLSIVMSLGVAAVDSWMRSQIGWSTRVPNVIWAKPKRLHPALSIGVAPGEKSNWLDQSTSTKCHLGQAKIVCTRAPNVTWVKPKQFAPGWSWRLLAKPQVTLNSLYGLMWGKQFASNWHDSHAYPLCKLKR